MEAGQITDCGVPDFLKLLRAGDLLVFNDVVVHPARLRATRHSGGAVEVLLTRSVGAGWEALVRPGRRVSVGETLRCGPGTVHLETRHDDGTWTVRLDPDVDTLTQGAGEVPLPPYLRRAPIAADRERYQTVYAQGPLRAAAAPTAGLHFTPEILAAMDSLGVERTFVTLEVGMGTFRPLSAEALATGRLHPERFVVPDVTWSAVARARAEGRRVVAIGTTVARVLEAMTGPGPGETSIFLREGSRWGVVDALFTNFHLPRSSLLMLVASFAGRDRVLAAYEHAVRAGYRFFSYGDAMFIPRRFDT